MKILLIALLLIIANNSRAAGIYVGAWSHHINQKEWRESGWPLNQKHNLIAYQNNKYLIGYYKNSFGDDTYMLDRDIYSKQIYDIKFTLYAGASYGYTFCAFEEPSFAEKKVCPHLFPEIKYTEYDLQPAFLIMPCCLVISFFQRFD
jgi:hypothetical protein